MFNEADNMFQHIFTIQADSENAKEYNSKENHKTSIAEYISEQNIKKNIGSKHDK